MLSDGRKGEEQREMWTDSNRGQEGGWGEINADARQIDQSSQIFC